jgi:chondroitin AC lyase
MALKKILCIIVILFRLFIPEKSFAGEIDQLKKNYVRLILNQDEKEQSLISVLETKPKETIVSDEMVVELMNKYPVTSSETKHLLQTNQADGSWSDIDYKSQDRSGWSPKKHIERILILARSYRSPQSSYYLSVEIENVIHRALKYWTTTKPVAPNWWHNSIGVPKNLGAALLLFEDKLSPEEKKACLEVMKNSKFGMTGQNKVWLAGNVLVTALLENDLQTAKNARDVIASEIIIGDQEGIQSDNSFHQHGPQQQFGNYGLAFISSMSFYAGVFANTSFQFDAAQLNILSNLINRGFRYVIWNGFMDINTLGRQVFNQSQVNKTFNVGFSSLRLSEVDSNNCRKYEVLVKDNFEKKEGKTSFKGLYHFVRSDLTVNRCADWMTSVKMSSNRVIGMEAGNSENLKGYYLADGATYTYVNGDEYLNIFPCWDWRKIPGVTCYEKTTPIPVLTFDGYRNKRDFVGNVSDDNVGLTAMDLNRDGLSAKKAWLFTDEFVLCLGAGINTDSNYVVTTSIDQQLKKSGLYQFKGKNQVKVDSIDLSKQKDIRFYCGNKGYIVMNSTAGKVKTDVRTGKWNDIMRLYPDTMIVKEEVFSAWISHGSQPQNASYQYLIIPSADAGKTRDFNLDDLQVISNTSELQAVYLHHLNKYFIAAYQPADAKLSNNIHLKSDQPGLFILSPGKGNSILTISDPTQKLETINVSINEKKYVVHLPSGNYKGNAVKIQL